MVVCFQGGEKVAQGAVFELEVAQLKRQPDVHA